MDLRPGGEWIHVMHGPDGTDYPNYTVFIEVDRPARLVYTNSDGDSADRPRDFRGHRHVRRAGRPDSCHHARAVCVRRGEGTNSARVRRLRRRTPDVRSPGAPSDQPYTPTRDTWSRTMGFLTDLRFAAAVARPGQGARRHRHRHAGARHRRQRRHLQRRPRRAAAAARQSRRGSPDLHPPERAGPRRRERHVLGAGDQGPARAASRRSPPSATSRPSTSR